MNLPALSLLPALALALKLNGAGLDLPDPLTLGGGGKVSTVDAWKTQRRPELLELFRKNVYGQAPVGRPASLKFEVTEKNENTMEGKATRKQVRISFRGPGGEGSIRLVLFVPNQGAKPAPCFLLVCNREPENIDPAREKKSPFWPAEEIVARGYAAAAFHNADVAPDIHSAWGSGVHAIFDKSPRPSDAWGTIAAWAWGSSRVLDYLETDGDIDKTRVALVGHSRGGKTALWAGAEDERFAVIVSNDSGCTGAKLARHLRGETIEQINTHFPHWFCENYKRFNGHPELLPVDQHELIALIAPRPVYIASASEDGDPQGEFLGALHASPVYALFGLGGLAVKDFPPADSAFPKGKIGYHLRAGAHNLLEYDWSRFMNFTDRHWGRSAKKEDQAPAPNPR